MHINLLTNSGLRNLTDAPTIATLNATLATAIRNSLKLTEEDDKWVRICNMRNDLILLHFFTPDNEISERAADIRGIIVNGEGKIVCRSFPHTPELDPSTDADRVKLNELTDPFVPTIAYEGTIIRIFHTDGNWYVSTHKTIDGLSSRWGNSTFGTSLVSIWGELNFDQYLNRTGTHTFLLSHPNNRIVCNTPPALRYVGTFANTIETKISYDGFHTPHPNVLNSVPIEIQSIDDLVNYCKNIDPTVATGVLLTFLSGNFIKVVSTKYQDSRKLRGSSPIHVRYIECSDEERKKMREMYKESTVTFDTLDKSLEHLIQYLEMCYNERYVKHKFLQLPPTDHYIVSRTNMQFDDTLSVADNIRNTIKNGSDGNKASTGYQIYSMINNMYSSRFFFNIQKPVDTCATSTSEQTST
jgi:hypothetical protein